MKFKPLLILLMMSIGVMSSVDTYAQKAEIGFIMGVATYQGDISPTGWGLNLESAQVARGIYLNYNLNQFASLKGSYISGNLSASDNSSMNAERIARNLHFRSSIKEFSIVGQFSILKMIPSLQKLKLDPYVNIGIGIFSFNPQAKYNDRWYDLQPLGTEGQGLPDTDVYRYSLTQFSIPFGMGLKYQFNELLNIGFEISPRWTFTDYLDDVSTAYPDIDLLREVRGDLAVNLSYRNQNPIDAGTLTDTVRGNSAGNDWYIFTTLSVAYRFTL